MRPIHASFALAAALTAAAPVLAQDAAPAPAKAPALAVPAAAPARPGAFGDASALGSDDLGVIAGREDVGTMIAQADQRNVVSDNSVSGNSVTGSVALDGNAFQNLQGMAVISANSGNNVAMNAALNVTINMAPR